MPTGYTADIYEGKDVSFEDFALNCARAFGAFAHLRDNPKAELSDKLSVDEYYVKQFEKAEADLEKVKYMTDEDFAIEAEKSYNEKQSYLQQTIRRHRELRARYENMLQQVNEWTVPTEQHTEFKKFMVDQLEQSIEFDTSVERYENELANLSVETVAEAKERITEDVEWVFDYARKQLEREEEAVAKRSEWVGALFRSLEK